MLKAKLNILRASSMAMWSGQFDGGFHLMI
ncbi:MAG: hypothetical protein JWP12_890 [Bacteroidetes bacterium]|nr:hypothetical protein [Bacteroidota bacterium]